MRARASGLHSQVLPSPSLDVWASLAECGVGAPGLQVVVTGKRDLLAVAGLPDHDLPVERARIDETLVVETFGPGALWQPSLRPGDVLVFAGTTVHRSHVTPAMTKPRLSVEMRLVAAGAG